MKEITFKITSEVGLHARPAAVIVKAIAEYAAETTLHYKDKEANAKSLLSVLSLAVPEGAIVTFKIEGSDEQEALKGIKEAMKGLGEHV